MWVVVSERSELEAAVAALEAQRGVLGDGVVDAAVGPMREKLAALLEAGAHTVPADDGERKFVTMIFADLSGSTALGEVLDPEEIRDLLNGCFDRLVPAVKGFGGTIDKFIGDNVMALFGAPVAHENDPERALRAALGMMEALGEFNADNGVDLGIHIGVNTGLVIAGGVGSEGDRQYSVLGDAVNVAARLEGASERGEILVGPDTRRLAGPLFEYVDLEPISVKGRDEPVAVSRLVGVRAGRESGRGIEGLSSPMVGRGVEADRFVGLLNAVAEGRGGVVAVVAEAGVGKSRFVAEARGGSPAEVVWVEGRALAYTTDTPYAMVNDLVRDLLGVAADASLDDVSGALAARLARVLPADAAVVEWPFLARLLDLPLGDDAARVIAQYAQTPDVLQQRTGDAFVRLVTASATSPLVLVWEDLHWADEASLYLLEELTAASGGAPVLLVLLFRPDDSSVWELHRSLVDDEKSGYEVIELDPLSREDSEVLIESLLHIENLPAAVRDLILGKAEGNPLFLEELVRALIDAGMVVIEKGRAVATDAITELHAMDVPDTVQGVIGARIDRLPADNKAMLQAASVIGRIFQRRILEHLTTRDDTDFGLDNALGDLQRLDFIDAQETGDSARVTDYMFKHVFTQEAAYNGILLARRKTLHKTTAEAIEAFFPERTDELSATLARHYEAADMAEKATVFLLQAAKRAAAAYANDEAVAFIARGLALTDSADKQGRSEFLLIREGVYFAIGQRDLQLEDLKSLQAIHDFLADEGLALEVTIRRAEYAVQGSAFEAAAEIATSAAKMAFELDDQSGIARAHRARGMAYTRLDRQVEAENDLQHALNIAQKLGMAQLELEALQRLGVMTVHGKKDLAEQEDLHRRALIIAERLGDRKMQAILYSNLATDALMRYDLDTAIHLATKSLQLGKESGFKRMEAVSNAVIAEALLYLGRNKDSLEASQHALEVATELDMELWVALQKCTIAESLSAIGQHDEAIKSAEEAVHQFRDLGMKPYLMESLACLTRAKMAAGDMNGAGAAAEEVMEYIQDGGSLASIDYPLQVYATCLKLLQETEDQRFDPLLSQAVHLLNAIYLGGGPMPWHIEIRRLSEAH